MAHFARINETNEVIDVIVIDDGMTMLNGVEDEATGAAFCSSLFGGTWLKTSYNTQNGEHFFNGTPFRKNFAVISGTYDSSRDAFIPPKPYPSWILNETTCNWEAPFPYTADGKTYSWDEATLGWVEVTPVITLP